MNTISDKQKQEPTLMDLMGLVQVGTIPLTHFHILKRKRIPNTEEIGIITDEGWQALKQELWVNFPWDAESELTLTRRRGAPSAKSKNYIHFKSGVTLCRDFDDWILLAYDHDCLPRHVEDFKQRVKRLCKKSSKHEIGFIQSAGTDLYLRYYQYKPYENDIIIYLDDAIIRLRDQMIENINTENGNGLYLLHGKPGTGKTSFIKSILSKTERKAIFLSPAMTDKLSSPEMVGLLMNHPNSILVIEDAETTLMKRAADNSSAVSNLLNMSDGFPADFLNLCIICTFNTELDNIDSALLRKGRLKGMMEFKPLNEEQARKIAAVIGISLDIVQPVTIADLCNSKGSVAAYESRTVGFN